MNSPSVKARTIVELLEAVLAGTQSSKAAIQKWPDIDREEKAVFKRAWHDLYHYSVDSDIQSKDPKYAQHQRELLLQRIAEIRLMLSREPGSSEN